ncbi:hypothetical protein HAZT_HAZT003736 [Hyalella azteca]|uniref:Endonuclease/exonuclease/phosphatase domain-containing protein n=1 Tax=Hyalella azteca TaxID=294128 RepID=A0A6A0HEW3_HYAAZ|nr:hypothetical protein HAZT_HAZT003736 [Hyalella azteca]
MAEPAAATRKNGALLAAAFSCDPCSNGQSTSPDILIASDILISIMDWTTATALASDHLPICVTLINEDLLQQRDRFRSTNLSSPNAANTTTQINRLTNNLKTTRWKEYLDTLKRYPNVKRLWTAIKALNGKPKL